MKKIIFKRIKLLFLIILFLKIIFLFPPLLIYKIFFQMLLKHCTGKPWKIVCTVLSLVIALDLCMTGTSIFRWSERHYGIQAQTRIQRELDAKAPDDWMQKRFMDWRFLDAK